MINPDGTGLMPFWHRMVGTSGILSPTGTEFVAVRPDPKNHYWVLFVGQMKDVTDVAFRQITRYEAVASTRAAQPSEDRNAPRTALP